MVDIELLYETAILLWVYTQRSESKHSNRFFKKLFLLTYNVLLAPEVQVCESSGLHISQHLPWHTPSPMSITQPPHRPSPNPQQPSVYFLRLRVSYALSPSRSHLVSFFPSLPLKFLISGRSYDNCLSLIDLFRSA